MADDVVDVVAEAVADAIEDVAEEAQDDATEAAQGAAILALTTDLASAIQRIERLEAASATYAASDHEHDLPEDLRDLAASIEEAVADLPDAVADAIAEGEPAAEREAEPLPGQVEAAEAEVASEAEEGGVEPDQAPHISHVLFRRFGHRG